VKVSADGGSWLEALVIGGGGLLRLPQGRLQFPATANPSGDPRALDDYEEGAWTPAVAFGGAASGVVHGPATGGRFTKIGRLCVASGTLVLTSKGSSSGAATITGLPHAALGDDIDGCGSIGWASGLSGVSGAVCGLLSAGGSQLTLAHSSGGAMAALTDAHFSDGSELRFSVSYDVA
jgi:hypothetical protein